MSDYKILHKRECGSDTWEVFYKDKRLTYYDPEITDIYRGSSSNSYRELEYAKMTIEKHKEHVKWLEQIRKSDTVEWLDEEGNPLPPRRPQPPETRHLNSSSDKLWLLVPPIVIIVGVIVASFWL